MLPAASRLTHRDDFTVVVRRGRSSGRPRLVVHVANLPGGSDRDGSGPRAGFVVSKAVGGSVIRHRVARRLRHLVAPRLAGLPAGLGLVVRALPPSALATSAELGADLDAGLRSALRKLDGRELDGRKLDGRSLDRTGTRR